MAQSIEQLAKQLKQERAEKAAAEDELSFMGTYGDAITLLMAFFVLLFAMSSLDVQKFEAFAAALAEQLGSAPAPGDSLVASGELDQVSDGPVFDQPLTLDPVRSPTQTDDAMLDAGELEETAAELREQLDDAELEELVEVVVTSEGLLLRVTSDDVLYVTGSPTVQEQGRQIIATVAPVLAEYDNPVTVTGHTDDVPINAGDYDNWALSTDRAVSVVRLLSEEYGVDPARLSAEGRGEHEPLLANVDAASRAANRRVEVLVRVDPTDGSVVAARPTEPATAEPDTSAAGDDGS